MVDCKTQPRLRDNPDFANPLDFLVASGGWAKVSAIRIRPLYPTYPYLEPDDIAQALSYAAWRAEEVETAIRHA